MNNKRARVLNQRPLNWHNLDHRPKFWVHPSDKNLAFTWLITDSRWNLYIVKRKYHSITKYHLSQRESMTVGLRVGLWDLYWVVATNLLISVLISFMLQVVTHVTYFLICEANLLLLFSEATFIKICVFTLHFKPTSSMLYVKHHDGCVHESNKLSVLHVIAQVQTQLFTCL